MQPVPDSWAYGPALNDSISLTQVMSTFHENYKEPLERLGLGEAGQLRKREENAELAKSTDRA